ncbi:MAG: hypothetical protein WCB31_06650 [Nitrososphaeraceae archaeon]
MRFQNSKDISVTRNGIMLILTIMIISLIFSTNVSLSQTDNRQSNDNIIESSKNNFVQIGKPIFVEKYSILYKTPIVMNGENATQFVFSGNGTVNEINVNLFGEGVSIPQSQMIQSIIGRAFISTETEDGGHASYFFQAVGHSEEELQKSKGAVFFSSNATGSLSLLSNMVGIYKTELNKNDELGTFIMWEWK